jgi:surface polysaccharide O-acyltransferase-like enzyme
MTNFPNKSALDSPPSRRTDLDALRGVAMILGIVWHALLSFIPTPWPVQDTRQDGFFFIPFAAIHMFRMPLFFVISGFFTMFILQRHGLGGMIRQRVERILIPLLLALLTIAPVDNLLTREARMMHAQDPSKKNPLIRAILSGDQSAVIRQLDMGTSVNEADPAYGLSPLCWASLSGNDQMVSLLLERGADLKWKDADGNTPLHHAALFCHPSTVRLLLEHGADPSVRDKAGSTPLGLCAMMLQWKRESGAKLGLQLPAEPELRRNIHETLLVLTQSKGSLSFSSWFDRLSAHYRDFLVSNDFLISVKGHSLHLFDEEVLDHLWFLWLLLWLVAGLSLSIRMGLPPSGKFLWWIPPLTLIPQAFMGTAFGPDLWLGPIPPPHLLLYYGLFFWFGAAVFSRDGMKTRMGRGWQILLPAGLLILLPAAFMLIGDRGAGSLVQCGYAWVVTLGIMGLFARYCSHLGYRAQWFSDSAYWMYLAHLPLVLTIQIAVVSLPWPPSLKFLLVMVVVTLLLLTSYRWLVRYTWIGTLLNGPRKPPQAG